MFKAITLESTIGFVSVYDPAIDHERTKEEYGDKWVDAYWDGMLNGKKWDEMMRIKDGARASVFVIGAIAPDDMIRVDDECSARPSERYWRCFLMGLRDIEGWPLKVEYEKRGDIKYVDREWLKPQFTGAMRNVAKQVGQMAWSYNTLSGDDVKK